MAEEQYTNFTWDEQNEKLGHVANMSKEKKPSKNLNEENLWGEKTNEKCIPGAKHN